MGGILVPQPGVEPLLPEVEAQNPNQSLDFNA